MPKRFYVSLPIERAMADNLRSPGWEPHVATVQDGVFASRFPDASSTLWTIVNRNEYDVAGPELGVPFRAGIHFYDLWHGTELKPDMHGSKAVLSFEIEGRGFGAVLATEEDPVTGRLKDILPLYGEAFRSVRLSSFSREWTAVPQAMVEIKATKPAAAAPSGMVMIPAGEYNFQVHGMEIEGGNDPGVDVQYPWENSPGAITLIRCTYPASISIARWSRMRSSRSSSSATNYHPKDDHNFLRDWKDGRYPQSWEDKPVTWVSIEDARLMQPGQGNAFRTIGSGNMRPNRPMDESIRGGTIGMQKPWRSPITGESFRRLRMWVPFPRVRVRPACSI